MKNNGRVNSSVLKLITLIFLTTTICVFFSSSIFAETMSTKDETNLGIEFDITKSTTTSSSSSHEMKKPKPITKGGGHLPQTGELMQPIIFLIIGSLLIALIIAIYFSTKSIKKGDH